MKKSELRSIIREIISEQNTTFSLNNIEDAISLSQAGGNIPNFSFKVCQLTAVPAGPISNPQSLGAGDGCFNYGISNPTTDELMSFLPLVDAQGYFPSGDNSCQVACVAPILGCTDPAASNFNPEADTDDGSCVILGCTDEYATNFNPNATTDDGSCSYPDPDPDDFSGGPGGGPSGGPIDVVDLGGTMVGPNLSILPSTMGGTYKTPQRDRPSKGDMQRNRMKKLANIKPRTRKR